MFNYFYVWCFCQQIQTKVSAALQKSLTYIMLEFLNATSTVDKRYGITNILFNPDYNVLDKLGRTNKTRFIVITLIVYARIRPQLTF